MKKNQSALEDCQAAGAKYRTVQEWLASGDRCLYGHAVRNGWINLCRKSARTVLTLEYCQTLVAGFKSRGEFKAAHGAAYSYARRRGWLDSVFEHLPHRVFVEGLRVVYAYVFDDRYAYVGLALERRLKIRAYHHEKHGPVFEHSKSSACRFIVLEPGLSAIEAINVEAKWHARLSRHHSMLNKAKTGALGGRLMNQYEDCRQDSLHCKTRTEWKRRFSSTYHTAHSQGWINELCRHMAVKCRSWTDDELLAEARKYRSKRAFATGSPSARTRARRRGLYSRCTAHMRANLRRLSLRDRHELLRTSSF